MIKNIPNKFKKENFLFIFNKQFEGKYNLFLLPTDIKEKKNYGYAFINFIHPFSIINFFYTFNCKKWDNTNSIKICEIVYSKIQGIPKMIKHYPIKAMYTKEAEESKEEDSNSTNSNTSNGAQNIEIPFVYANLFQKIYPDVTIEYDATSKEFFSFDMKSISKDK